MRSTCTTQTVIGLSSGESEFYSAVKAGSVVLGCGAMLKDLGHTVKTQVVAVRQTKDPNPFFEIHMDATAGKGIAERRGAGKIRHIATPTLWLQKHVCDGNIKVIKVPGPDNCADMGTKMLDAKTLAKHCSAAGFRWVAGESAMAYKATLEDIEHESGEQYWECFEYETDWTDSRTLDNMD